MSPLYAVVLPLLFLIATTNRSHFVHGSSRGCIELDDLTFDRVLQRYPDGALIKFDVAYPYGDKQQVYEQFAADVAASAGGLGALDLLVGCVGIKDYGEKDGATLAKRFAVTADYPDVQLFVGGATGRRVRFPSSEPFTAEALKQFVRHNSRINLGLAGCVPELDRLAAELVGQLQLGEADEVDGTLAKARDWVEAAVKADPNDRNALAGPMYMRLMQMTVDKGLSFVPLETKRVRQLLAGKVAVNKRRELEQRLNVLKAFDTDVDELDGRNAIGADEL